jgi:arginyl-tRNA synthetase
MSPSSARASSARSEITPSTGWALRPRLILDAFHIGNLRTFLWEDLMGRVFRALGWRVTPELRFYIDSSVDSGMRIEEALLHVPPTLAAERAAEAAAQTDVSVSTVDDETEEA